jgi:carbamoyltransferase
MGLAAYGDAIRYRETLKRFLRPTATGFAADPEVLEFRLRRFDGLERLLGPARRHGEALENRFADLAAALQEATDRIMLRLAELAHEHVGSATLCLAGGVALNCRSNWVLKEHGPFAEVFVPPGAHDAGTAIGAAMLVSARAGARPGPSHSPYIGPAFDDDALAATIRAHGLEAHRAPDIADEVAGLLADGSVVGWFQEAMEFGPRALGNRSLLADPRDPGMRDTLNRKVKHREEFRPFAPSVVAEKAESWFEMGRPSVSYEYMLFACPVRVEQANRIPAVVHEDGTSRIQIVRADANARFHRLLSCFEERTGVPLLLNTSFNDSEPIVCTPEDALATFAGTRIDAVALGDLIVRRPPRFDTRSEHDDRLTAAV